MNITAIAPQTEKWWAIDVPEIGFMTQVKRLTDIDSMTRSLTADVLEIDPETIKVTITALLPHEVSNTADDAKSKKCAPLKLNFLLRQKPPE